MSTRTSFRAALTAMGCATAMAILSGCPNTGAPTVSTTDPVDNATNVPVQRDIAITFSRAMSPASINANTVLITRGVAPVSGTVAYSGVTATFNPTSPLLPNTVYTGRVTTGATAAAAAGKLAQGLTPYPDPAPEPEPTPDPDLDRDPTEVHHDHNHGHGGFFATLAGLLFAGSLFAGGQNNTALANDYVWTFTTGSGDDATAPTVSATTPAGGSNNVAISGNLSATFSESISPASVNATSFTLSRGSTPVLGTVSYSGITAMFNPTLALIPLTEYTARITTAVEDLAGNALAVNFSWSFTTGTLLDGTAPTVTSVTPINNATGVSVSTNPTATFSEAMNPLTINATSFRLSNGLVPIVGTVAYSGVTAIFNPIGTLSANTLYTATITNTAADMAGNTLASNFVWTFRTSTASDTTAPRVSATVPRNGAVNVARGGNLSATFTEAMNPLTISNATFTLSQGLTPVLGTVSYAGVTATFNPLVNLTASTQYTATITTGAADTTGNTLANNFVWTFTTGTFVDVTRPTVSSTVPADGAIGVPLGRDLSATFSEAINPLTINTTSFTLTNGDTPVLGNVTYAGVTATFDPFFNLAASSEYTATITTVVRDLAGNAIAEDYVWTFTTGTAVDNLAPTVTSTIPTNGSTGVALGGNLLATFSEPMSTLSINAATFTLENGATPVLGTVSYVGVTATFNPVVSLTPNTEYTATITTGAMDLAGNELVEDFVWTFTTGNTADSTAPTVSATFPEDGATGVALGGNLSADFSEAMDPLSITPTSFKMERNGVQILGIVTYSGVTATYNPFFSLAANTEYVVTITTEATDLAGNALAEDFVWTITTGASADTTNPTILSTIPATDATDVPLGRNLSVTFSEPMNPLTINTVSFSVVDGASPVLGTVTYTGVTATFNPLFALTEGTQYVATVTTDATDLAGNTLAADRVWAFTTGTTIDVTAPTVVVTTPADGSIDVARANNLVVTFSEALDPLTINTATFTVDNGTVAVVGTVTYSGVTAVFNPVLALAPNTEFFGTIQTGVRDLAGNAVATEFTWSFTTGADLLKEVPAE